MKCLPQIFMLFGFVAQWWSGGRMTTADQLAIVNRLLQAPAEAYSLAQVNHAVL